MSRPGVLRRDSGYRSRPPEETFEVAAGLAARLGISRVTDSTRLDRLGLPVFCSIRPRGRVLRVHAGKGLRPADARTGALMEAVEHAVAEPDATSWTMRRRRVGEIVEQFENGLQWVDFAPHFGVRTSASQRVDAIRCERVGSGAMVWLPAELVFVPYLPSDGRSSFGYSTNGLASGNSLEEATLHALLEVLERDTLALHLARDESRWVVAETLPPWLGDRAAAWRTIGVELAVRYLPNVHDLPCFEACIRERGSDNVNLAIGSGLHADRDIALVRAVSEAAQSRMSHIHGGRDDITDFYDKYTRTSSETRIASETRFVDRIFGKTRSIAYDDIPGGIVTVPSLSSLLGILLARLERSGFDAVYRHRFDADFDGLQVVRVIVARCEEASGKTRRMGRRLLARIVGDA